jgi:hypothetical protein
MVVRRVPRAVPQGLSPPAAVAVAVINGRCTICAELRSRTRLAEREGRPEIVEAWEDARLLHLKYDEPHKKETR